MIFHYWASGDYVWHYCLPVSLLAFNLLYCYTVSDEVWGGKEKNNEEVSKNKNSKDKDQLVLLKGSTPRWHESKFARKLGWNE